MISRKSMERFEILDSPHTYHRKISRNYHRVHNNSILTVVVTYIIALLVLSTEAQYEFGRHRPRPGRPFFKPIPLSESQTDTKINNEPSVDRVEVITIMTEPVPDDDVTSTAGPTPETINDVIIFPEDSVREAAASTIASVISKAESSSEIINDQIIFPEDPNLDVAACTIFVHSLKTIQEVELGEDTDAGDEDLLDDGERNDQIKNDPLNYQNDSGPHEEQSQITPQEELDQMIEGLGTLLSNESAVVTVADVSTAFDQMDALLSTEVEDLEFPCTVLTALDALGARADLNGSTAASAARRNVAVVMADSEPERPVRGLRVAAAEHGFTDETLQILQDGLDPTSLNSDDTEAVVNLPEFLGQISRRISFVVFRSDRAFLRHDTEQYEVNSKIISVNVENFMQMENGEVIDIHLKPSSKETPRNMTRACAYWHFGENGTGYWSQDGCIFIESSAGLLDTCRCTHLTHFAEVLIPRPVFSEDNETALEIISLIGCFLSLFGLLGIALTAIVFRSWRNDFNNKIWLQLTIALLINVVSFLIIVFSKFKYFSMFCLIVGVILHYAVLASFCWMLVAGIISYRKLVLVFARDPRRRLLKASVFSWLFPLIVVATLVYVDPRSYTSRFAGEAPMGGFCYPSELGLWLTVFTPIAIVVATNWILFGLIIRSVFGSKKIQKHGDSGEMIRRASVSCLLVFLFGLPWVLGLFAYNVVVAYFFTFMTSYQGFVLFLFFIIINTKTRGMWLNRLRIKKKAKITSSSLTNTRNAPASNESEQSPFIEPSSTRTNITSLMSNSSDGKAVAYNITSGSAVIEDSRYNSKDSDIDSFITAKSHENFSEDEIFRSMEGITDQLEDAKENKTMQGQSASNPGTFSEDSVHPNKISTTNNEVAGLIIVEDLNTAKTDDSISVGIPVAKLKDDNSSIRHDESFYPGQEVRNSNASIGPEITLYNVPTQNASLIT